MTTATDQANAGDSRRTSQIEFLDEVPWKSVCFLRVAADRTVRWISAGAIKKKRQLLEEAQQDGAPLYMVWGGRYRDDLFLIDNHDAVAKAL